MKKNLILKLFMQHYNKSDDEIKEKKRLEKIILCDVPKWNLSRIRKIIFKFMHNSGHPDIKLEKKIDFNKLYNEKFN